MVATADPLAASSRATDVVSRSNATRYLSTAAYVDPGFARAAVDEILFTPHRAVVPSVGFDLTVVLRHCVDSLRRRYRTGLVMVVTALVALYLASYLLSLAVTAFVVIRFCRWWLRSRRATPEGRRTGVAGRVLVSVLVVLVLPFGVLGLTLVMFRIGFVVPLVLFALACLLVARQVATAWAEAVQAPARLGRPAVTQAVLLGVVQVVAAAAAGVGLFLLWHRVLDWNQALPDPGFPSQLDPFGGNGDEIAGDGFFEPGPGTSTRGLGEDTVSVEFLAGLGVQLVGALAAVASWYVFYRYRRANHEAITRMHPDTWDPSDAPPAPGEVTDRLAELGREQREGNVTFFSGPEPFLGYGLPVDDWNFAVILKPEDDDDGGRDGTERDGREVEPFSVAELAAHVRQRVGALSGTDLPVRDRLHGLRIKERCYARGLLTGSDPNWLPDPLRAPVSHASEELLRAVRDDSDGWVRHYDCFEVGGWAEEQIVVVLLHYSISGGVLHLEFYSRLLPPIQWRFRQSDWLLPLQHRPTHLRLVWQSARDWPAEVIGSVAEVVAGPPRPGRGTEAASEVATASRLHRQVDYGARLSLRDRAAARAPDHRLQLADLAHHRQVVEKQVLEAVLDFLQEHRVDVAEFRAFRASRVEQYVVNSFGGITTVGAMGRGARGTAVQAGGAGAGAAPVSGSPR